jgi:hypothetical protein
MKVAPLKEYIFRPEGNDFLERLGKIMKKYPFNKKLSRKLHQMRCFSAIISA